MRKFRKLSVPDRAHPLVREMFKRMNHEQIGVLDLARRSGINKNTIRDWRTRTVPTVDNFLACMNVLGLTLEIKALPDHE